MKTFAKYKVLIVIGLAIYLLAPFLVMRRIAEQDLFVVFLIAWLVPLAWVGAGRWVYLQHLKKKQQEKLIRLPIKFLKQKHFSHQTTPNNALVTGAEIGVHNGRHASQILSLLNVKKLYLVDPWASYTDHGIKGFPDDEQEAIYQEVEGKFSGMPNVEIIRKMSAEAVAEIRDLSLDFVYIDGNHEYEYVLEDLRVWYPKVKPDGVLGGDDFGHPSSVGLIRAVTEFAYEKKLLVFSERNQFFMVKV